MKRIETQIREKEYAIKANSRALKRVVSMVDEGRDRVKLAKSELTRALDPKYDFLGFIRRGEHVTCLYRVRSKKKAGEWLGRMVLGYEDGEVKIFGASIF